MKLRIVYILPSFPATTETFLVNQITDMIDRGHEISIYAIKKNQNAVVHQKVVEYDLMNRTSFYEEPDISLGKKYYSFLSFILKNLSTVNFFRILKNYSFSNFRKAFFLRYYYKYYWILKRNKAPHIIHVHFADKAKLIANIKRDGFFCKSKLVVSFHGYDLEPAILDRLKVEYKPVFEEADLLTVNSLYTKSLLDEITSHKKIKIIPVGLDTSKFKILSRRSSGRFNILFLGRLVNFKGPHLAIDIIEILKERGYKEIIFTIIGVGPLKSDLEQKILRKGLQQMVSFKGQLSQEEIIQEMEDGDVLLLPGIYDKEGRAENQGLVIQEAQSMGIPVIVSDAGGMKYGLLDGKSGFVVKEKDNEAFADKIEYLINNPRVRLAMGTEGRKYTIDNYDSKILGNKLEEAYLQILNKE